MTLEKWLTEGRIEKHQTSKNEIESLFRLVSRDIKDAQVTLISIDRRFATAYNAVLQLSNIIINISGYRVKAKQGHHMISLQLIPELMGNSRKKASNYFNICRTKRNITDYDREGEISQKDLEELLNELNHFQEDVLEWITTNHPEYLND